MKLILTMGDYFRGQQDMLERVFGSMYDSMLDEENWPKTSAHIDGACRVKGDALVVGEGYAEQADIFFTRICYRGRHDQVLERLYFDHYFPKDERLPRIRQLPDNKLVRVHDLYTPHERKISPTYNELLPLAALPERHECADGRAMRVQYRVEACGQRRTSRVDRKSNGNDPATLAARAAFCAGQACVDQCRGAECVTGGIAQ